MAVSRLNLSREKNHVQKVGIQNTKKGTKGKGFFCPPRVPSPLYAQTGAKSAYIVRPSIHVPPLHQERAFPLSRAFRSPLHVSLVTASGFAYAAPVRVPPPLCAQTGAGGIKGASVRGLSVSFRVRWTCARRWGAPTAYSRVAPVRVSPASPGASEFPRSRAALEIAVASHRICLLLTHTQGAERYIMVNCPGNWLLGVDFVDYDLAW